MRTPRVTNRPDREITADFVLGEGEYVIPVSTVFGLKPEELNLLQMEGLKVVSLTCVGLSGNISDPGARLRQEKWGGGDPRLLSLQDHESSLWEGWLDLLGLRGEYQYCWREVSRHVDSEQETLNAIDTEQIWNIHFFYHFHQ